MVSLGTQPANRKSGFGHSSPTGARAQDLSRQPACPDLWGAGVSNDPGLPDLMEGQQRGRAPSDGDLANPSRTQNKRPESAEEPIAHSEVRRTLARTAPHDQLLLEQEILSDDGSPAAGSAELRGCDGQVEAGGAGDPSCARQRRSELRRHVMVSQASI